MPVIAPFQLQTRPPSNVPPGLFDPAMETNAHITLGNINTAFQGLFPGFSTGDLRRASESFLQTAGGTRGRYAGPALSGQQRDSLLKNMETNRTLARSRKQEPFTPPLSLPSF
jgi:hypothetical protein